MACRYCYAGRATKPDMSQSTAYKCVDFALGSLAAGKPLDLCMFGGEPFLRFELLQQVTAYAYRQAAVLGKVVHVSVTTNGTLISPEIVDFSKENDVRLCFSLDGPPDLHDRNRRYRDQRATFEDVMRNLEFSLKRLRSVEVNAVFGPETIDEIPRCVEYFVDAGVSLIHLNPNIKAVWPDELGSRLPDIYSRLANYYIACYQEGREITVNLLDDKMLLLLKGGYESSDTCSMGDGEMAFAPSGNIYPCERFIGEDDDLSLCLGNIQTGIDARRRCSLRARRGNHNVECPRCKVVKYCMNWCGCTNYFMSGHTDLAASILCAMERANIAAARRTFDTLVLSGNDLFMQHMYRYVEAGFHLNRAGNHIFRNTPSWRTVPD